MNGVVNAAVQEAPQAEGGGVKNKNKNTGFPEPLSQHRNTTLPHPSADTSPNACIESSDVAISRTHSRHSSFQLPRLGTNKYRAKISGTLGGPASPGGLNLPDEGRAFFQDADGPAEERALDQLLGSAGVDGQLDSPPRKETGNENGMGQDWEHAKDDHERVEGARKKGVLRKLHLHHQN